MSDPIHIKEVTIGVMKELELEGSMGRLIDDMSQEEMARAWRFSRAGDPLFKGKVGEYFRKVFNDKGGMTPEISKRIGWYDFQS